MPLAFILRINSVLPFLLGPVLMLAFGLKLTPESLKAIVLFWLIYLIWAGLEKYLSKFTVRQLRRPSQIVVPLLGGILVLLLLLLISLPFNGPSLEFYLISMALGLKVLKYRLKRSLNWLIATYLYYSTIGAISISLVLQNLGWQAWILGLALGGGVAAVFLLDRMEELRKQLVESDNKLISQFFVVLTHLPIVLLALLPLTHALPKRFLFVFILLPLSASIVKKYRQRERLGLSPLVLRSFLQNFAWLIIIVILGRIG